MTAFTYRFAPALRYLTKLCKDGELGELRHFRSQRFLDWPETSWGWRQYKATAGAGAVRRKARRWWYAAMTAPSARRS